MSEHKHNLTNRLEDLFLSILRNVILIVLALSIIGSVGLLISGISDSTAKAKEYKYEKFDSKQLINDLKDSLQEQPASKPEEKPEPAKKSGPQASSPFENEITKQANFIVQFYKQYDFVVNTSWLNEQLKPSLRKQAGAYSIVYGEGDDAKLEYAKGQSQVYELVLLNPELNKLLDKKFKSQGDIDNDLKYQVIHDFESKVVDFYPDFHKNQLNQKNEFEADQQSDAAMRQAGALLKIYIAGGMFVAFLLISLILVLVKIERNLRSVKIDYLDDQFTPEPAHQSDDLTS